MEHVGDKREDAEVLLEHHRTAALQWPLDAAAHQQLGSLLHRLGRDDDALDPFLRAGMLMPESADIQTAIEGYRLDAATLDARMLDILTGLAAPVVRAPGPVARIRAALALRRARAAARRGDWRTAQRRYQAVVRSDPHRARTHVQLGHAQLQQGAAEDALASYRRALFLSPGDPDIRLHVGHALKRLGRSDSAFHSYWASWRARPGFAPAAAELRALRPWIDDAWLDAAADGSPPLDQSSYYAVRARPAALFEPAILDAGARLYFRCLEGSLRLKS